MATAISILYNLILSHVKRRRPQKLRTSGEVARLENAVNNPKRWFLSTLARIKLPTCIY